MRINKLALLVLLPSIAYSQVLQEQSFSLSTFSGFIDILSPDRLADKYSPDCLNVRTDDLGVIAKRKGTVRWNTPFSEAQIVHKLYTYNKTDGSSYVIANSSWSVYANTAGSSLTSIKTSLNASYPDSYITAKDNLYRDNGYDGLGSKWDGTTLTDITVVNSTGMVSGKILAWWHNRYFKAGESDNPNVIYYSEANQPENFQPNNYINVSIDDGDVLTALLRLGDRLLATKRYATYEVIENSAGSFILRLINDRIGCLFPTTYDKLNDVPLWMSHRGVEAFNGRGFELLSSPIDNFVSALPQLNSGLFTWTQTTGDDWASGGTITQIDTGTVSGSFTIDQLDTAFGQNINQSQSAGNIATGHVSTWQTFMTSYTAVLSSVAIYNYGPSAGTLRVVIKNSDNTTDIVGGVHAYPVAAATGWKAVDLSSSNVVLTSGTVYYLNFTDGRTHAYQAGNQYTRGRASFSSDEDILFRIYLFNGATDGQFQTQEYDGTGRVTSWMSAEITDTIPTGTSVQYFVVVATASPLLTAANKDFRRIHPPNYLFSNSTATPYVLLYASATTEFVGRTPQIDDMSVKFLSSVVGNPSQVPVGITFEDRYYLFFATNTATNRNNCVLCYQKDGSWTLFNNIHGLSACVYLGKLYTGSSDDNGLIYETFVDDVYSDDDSAYPAYWKSKLLSFGTPLQRKLLKNIWLYADKVGSGNIYVDCTYDDSSTSTTLTFPNVSTRAWVKRLPFPGLPKSTYLQYKIYNNVAGEYFRVRGITTSFAPLPPE